MAEPLPPSLVNARNCFRPFFRPKLRRPYWQQVQTVRNDTPVASLPLLFSTFENNANYTFPGFGNNFPRTRLETPNANFRMIKPLSLRREAIFQLNRLAHYRDQIVSAVNLFGDLHGAIIALDFSTARSLVDKVESEYGHSFLIAKKRLLLGILEDGLAGLGREYEKLTISSRQTAWSLLCKYVYDIADPSYHPSHAAYYWLSVCRSRTERGDYYGRIVSDDILDYLDTETFALSALRQTSLSLIDLSFFFWRRLSSFNFPSSELESCIDIDDAIFRTLSERFSSTNLLVPATYYTLQDNPDDLDIFRTSIFFSEFANIARWRSEICFLIHADFPESGGLPENLSPLGQRLASRPLFSGDVEEAFDPAIFPSAADVIPNNQEVGGNDFIKTIVIARFIRRGMEQRATLPNDLCYIIISREDMFLYIPEFEIENYLAKIDVEQKTPLSEFVLRDLLYRRHRSLDNELERRLSFMSLFKDEDASAIVSYLEEIKISSPDASMAIASICTRPFLERLYMMVSSVKEVLETRLSLCGWVINNTQSADDTLLEEYDAVERELATLDIRSDLDSTRVHVDEESLRLWFYSTQITTLTRYNQTVFAEGSSYREGSLLQFYSRHKSTLEDETDHLSEETQIGSEFLLLDMIDKTLDAFAKDKSFGLDAYLSRRIRHGTLRGQLITPIIRHLNRRLIENTELSDHERELLAELISDWTSYLRDAVDNVRKNVIQITGPEHPDGLIRATWRSAGNIAHVDAMVARARQRTLETRGDYDPFPDLHSLCWDCIEPDLAQLRRYMLKTFLTEAQNELNDLLFGLSQKTSTFSLNAIRQDVSTQLNSRIQEICGWFIRPVFRRDKYSLHMLISSTLSIVRELNDDYKFTSDITCTPAITLSRAAFDVFSDVLFVLIGNAAAHGTVCGEVRVSADIIDEELNVVRLIVTSETENVEARAKAVERMHYAVSVGSNPSVIEQAAVEEGFTGLRKIVGLLRRVKSAFVQMSFDYPEDSNLIVVEVHLPSDILARVRLSS